MKDLLVILVYFLLLVGILSGCASLRRWDAPECWECCVKIEGVSYMHNICGGRPKLDPDAGLTELEKAEKESAESFRHALEALR